MGGLLVELCFCLPAYHHHHHLHHHRPVYSPCRPLCCTRSSEPPPQPSGDTSLQQTLVQIVRLQTDKVRVSQFLDQKSQHLTYVAQQAMAEYDRISQHARTSIDQASAKALKTVQEDAQAFEEELASARAEIEASDEELDEFEKKVATARNEGLFFKGLYKPLKPWKDRAPEEQIVIKEQAKKIAEITTASMGSKSRQNVYVLMILLLSLILLEGLGSGEISWPRVAIYGALILFLILQVAYESSVSSNTEETEKR